MANAEGDDDVEDAEPQDVDNEAREMNDWGTRMPTWALHLLALIVKIIMCIVAMDAYKSKARVREAAAFSLSWM